MPFEEPITPDSIQPGMLLCDRYRIEYHLAEGGMASIYKAIDETSGLPVAIKVLFSHYSDNAVVRARFLDEGRIQAMLNHPNIVHVYRVITDPILSFVMEFIDGETLEEYLQRTSALSEIEVVDLILPVMSAVGFAHQKGIIHRDLKPSNVLLKRTSGYLEPKVMDFGVAKVHRERKLTVAGTTVGTLHYMSPEQIVGASTIDGRADIYSLGCTLYKLCTGEVPFNASSEFALMMAQVEAPPTPPRTLRADLSNSMEAIILKALSKEPGKRFQTIKEMTQALMNLAAPEIKRDTDTRPIPASLLQFAMDADEVARDQTSQYRLANLDDDNLDPEELARETVDYSGSASNMTHELSRTAVKRIDSDRLIAALRRERKSADITRESFLDNLSTIPEGSQADVTLRAAGLQQTSDTEDDDQLSTRELSSQNRRTREFDRKKSSRPSRRGVVAVQRPGVDSKEVTSQRIPQEDFEEARRRSGQHPAADPLSSNLYSQDEDRTSEQRPSALRAGYARQQQLAADPNPDSVTSKQRPSALKKGFEQEQRRAQPFASDLDPPDQIPFPTPESLRATGPSRASTDRHRQDPSSSDSSDSRYLLFGALAFLIAILVLIAAFALR